MTYLGVLVVGLFEMILVSKTFKIYDETQYVHVGLVQSIKGKEAQNVGNLEKKPLIKKWF